MNISTDKMKVVDPWFWAYQSKIKLVGGAFSLEGHEYQVKILQSKAKRICCKKATQMAFTEAFVLRTLHKLIYRYYTTGCLYMFPTGDDVTDFSDSRFNPLIEGNPRSIGQYVKNTNRTGLKKIGDAYLYFRGAKLSQEVRGKKTSSKLKAIPVDAFVADEVDEMPEQAIEMAKGRFKHSFVQEEAYLANPTIPNFGIDAIYAASDQNLWMIKCEKCGKETCLEVEFPNCLYRKRDGSVVRLCVHCHDRILNPSKGFWVPSYPDKSKDMEGYWISHLNSVYVNPADILNKFEDPNITKIQKQELYNLALGMAYIDADNQLVENDIYNLCTREPMVMSHPGPTAMGVDIGSKLHVVVGYRPNDTQVAALYMARVSSWEDVHDIAKRMNVQTAVIDVEPELHKAREFQKHEPYQIFLCDYYEKQRKNPSFDSKDGMVKINRTEMLDATHDLVKIKGRYSIPRKSEEVEQYAKEMCNTVKVLREDEETNSRIYTYIGLGSHKPDHYRHATNYFLLASMKIPVYVEREYVHRPLDAWDQAFQGDNQEEETFLKL